MANTTDIKKGLTIELNKDLWTIVDFQHVKPGKGGAFVRTKLKSLTSGKVVDNTFNSGESLTLVSIERRKHQFLYKDLTGYNFMDNGTFEQVTLAEEMIDGYEFLKEGQEVEIIFQADNDRILGCDLPLFVFLDVTYSEPGLK
ncbi:MAG: elongation factor P, partial [Sphingobacteriales bacterium]